MEGAFVEGGVYFALPTLLDYRLLNPKKKSVGKTGIVKRSGGEKAVGETSCCETQIGEKSF